MKGCNGTLPHTGSRSNERGSAAYSAIGVIIIVLVVVGTIIYVPWSDLLRGSKDTSFAKATSAMADKDWDKAVNFFGKAIEKKPDDPAAYLGRSRAHLQKGQLDKAMKDADKVLTIQPNNATAHGQRGIVLKLRGKLDDSYEAFSNAIKSDAKYFWALAQRADLLSRKKEQEKALADVQKALDAKPDYYDGFRLRALILTRLGKCKEAMEDFDKVSRMRPDDPWIIQDKAWFLLTCPDEKLQNPSKALELAKKASELSGGKNPLVQETLAEAYYQQGDPLKAAELQEKAVSMKKGDCPDGSCVKGMEERLHKYRMAARQEKRSDYEILSIDSVQ
jgi:tetratricopeptide (TPR) repeat protein